jgi:ABC-2 type transport system permease protein
MSYALQGVFGSSEEEALQILAVNQDRGDRAEGIIRALRDMQGFQIETTWEGQPLSQEVAESLIVAGRRGLAVIFPPEFSSALEQPLLTTERLTATVTLLADPVISSQFTEPLLGTLRGLIAREAFAALAPQGIELLFDQFAPDVPQDIREVLKSQARASMSSDNAPVNVVQRAPAGMQVALKPNTFQQNIPSYTIYGIFWIVNALALSVLQEKRDGTFRRLMVAPLSRTVLLAGKLLPYYAINLSQIAILLGVSSALFGMSLGHSPAGLIAVSLAAAASALGLGVLVSAIARTESQAAGLSVILILTMSALGGCFVPRFIMPDWLRTLGLITPQAWALDAYQDLLVRGYGLREVLTRVGALLGFAGIFFGIGVWRFRFE